MCILLIQSILSNLAIILLMHLVLSMFMNIRHKLSPFLLKNIIVLITSAAVISMFYLPIRFDDYWVDMRLIPLIFTSFLNGWTLAIPTLIITSIWRFFMGGAGMVPGIVFGMIGPTLLALAFRLKYNRNGHYLQKLAIIITCWLISDFPITFILPNGLEIFERIAILRSTSFIATAITLYIFITHEQQRSKLNEEQKKLANEDYLTKLFNRRKFLEEVHKKITHPRKTHYIAMMDIDYFKQLNDTYGHIVGDEVLIKIGKILKTYVCEHIIISRYGGEEFLIYIDSEANDDALKIIEDIRKKIKSVSFPTNDAAFHITVSIGVTKLDQHTQLISAINNADKNLYEAKENGRDCVVNC